MTSSNNIQPLSINTFDIDPQHDQTFPHYNNKTKDQYYPRASSTLAKQNQPNPLISTRSSLINNIVSIPSKTPDPKILSSEEK